MARFCIGEDEEESPVIFKRRRVSDPSSESVQRFRSWIVVEEEDFGNGNNDRQNQQEGIPIGAVLTDLEVFDCPICLDQLFTPVFQCDNGHIICSSCCFKLNKKCPFCCMPIDTRCRGLEKFIESIIISCKYAQNGCKNTIPYCNKNEHEQMCPYITCFCPQPSCCFSGSARRLYVHFDSRHQASVTRFTYNTTFSVSIELNQKQIYLQQQCGSVLFILNHQVQERGRGRTFFIDCVGRDRLKNMFAYQLTAKTKYLSISFKSVPDISTKCCNNIHKRSYLTVPSEFADNNGLLYLSVCINKGISPKEIEVEEKAIWDDRVAHKVLKVVLTDPDILDCLSCREPLSTPVFQCETSHLVCSSCCSNLKSKCSSCGYNGCKVALPYDKKSEHEEVCEYATRFCPYPS